MEKGVSLYPGMGHPVPESLTYLQTAKAAGFNRLFTSLHIPEADPETLLNEFREITSAAAEMGFSVTADISPRTFRLLDVSPSNTSFLAQAGLKALRLDFGFSVEEIAAWTRSGLAVELNASTIDEPALTAIIKAGADPKKIQACHNYYPRPDTGISYELFTERNRLFHSLAIPVAAFIPSLEHPRGPLHAGLPTLEQHRSINTVQAAKHLIWDGQVEAVIIGDPLASGAELRQVGAVEAGCVELLVELSPEVADLEKNILFADHTNRTDPGEWVVRSAIARSLATEQIPAGRTLPRGFGSVTIDNSGYMRYMGELQLLKKDLPADNRVNVVARVISEELFLIDLIRPGMKFRFRPAY